MKRHLNKKQIAIVISIIRSIEGKITWDHIRKEIRSDVGEYSRQALDRHKSIRLAYRRRRNELRDARQESIVLNSQKTPIPAELYADLRAEHEQVIATNRQLLERFARWIYNAQKHNIDLSTLDDPMPPPDRSQTKEKKSS